MKQSTAIVVLLGVTVLSAVALLYFLLADQGTTSLSPPKWLFFAALSVGIVVAAFAPSLVRRSRGLRAPRTLSPTDIRACILVTVVGCILAVYGVYSGMWWMMMLGIMLAPLSFMFRSPRVQPDEPQG